MRKELKVAYGNNCMFLGMSLETSKVQKWSMGSKESTEGPRGLHLVKLSHIYMDMTLKPAYIGMCAKGQIVLEFSLMWIRVTCLLAFHMP